MDSDRWHRIEDLYHSALEQPTHLRARFLAHACGGDAELVREVEELLAHDEDQNSILDRPAFERGAELLGAVVIPVGTLVGPYRVREPLGTGGMGIVYRAEDTRLGRQVAIKFLRMSAAPGELRQRLEREAKVIASISHPNICALYDVGSYNDADYIVMEHVRGETLRARLNRGSLPLAVAIRTAIQIADALAAAHANGIVHRDLKPENIILAETGAKVLDFGLARVAATSSAGTVPSETLTGEGAVMGTPAYMAPEQIEGRTADARTDVFALGLVLYEMLSGARAFDEQSHARLSAAILTRDPDFTIIQGSPLLLRAQRTCLEKDPSRRWQSAADLRQVLECCLEAPSTSVAEVRRHRLWAWVAACASLFGVYAAFVWVRTNVESLGSIRFSVMLPAFTTLGTQAPVLSRDGKDIAFLAYDAAGKSSIQIRALDSETSVPVEGTDGAGALCWSPDAKWIAFFSEGKLKKLRRSGGRAQTLAESNAISTLTWGSKGEIIFAAGNRTPLFAVHESGGTPRQITQLDSTRGENSHRAPEFLPDGRRYLYAARCTKQENNALYIGSLDTGTSLRVGRLQSNAMYVPANSQRGPGILHVRDGVLVWQSFDGAKFSAEPVPVLEGLHFVPSSMHASFRVSFDGRVLVYSAAKSAFDQLTWFNRTGAMTGTLGPPGIGNQVRISVDGNKIATNRPDSRGVNRDIWIVDAKQGTASRVTSNPGNDWFGVWAPDGHRIAFGSDRHGGPGHRAYLKLSLNPEGPEIPLLEQVEQAVDGAPHDWSRDGQWMALVYFTAKNQSDIYIAKMGPVPKLTPYLVTEFDESSPRFSPDGNWLAYVSDESGRSDVYVRPFRGHSYAPEGKIRVTAEGGDFPVWSRTGDELYFMTADGSVYAADTRQLNRGTLGRPMRLYQACPGTGLRARPGRHLSYTWQMDVTPDGRFLLNCMAELPGRFTVWVNWQPEDSSPGR